MNTYITKEIALDAISHAETLSEAFRLINNQKAADVVEVRHGLWVVKGDAQPISNDKVYGCSLCDDNNRRYYEWQLSNYCPNCGAKMDGRQTV